jgi:hypothetical protein
MKPKIYYIIYISTATQPFSKPELLELLTKSRENNTKLGLTGMLLYKNDVFQQILEGPEEAVNSLFQKIKKDPRHHDVVKATDGFQAKRQFTDWSMGYCDLNSAAAAATPGYLPFMNTPLSDEQFITNPGLCRLFMLIFKQNIENLRPC